MSELDKKPQDPNRAFHIIVNARPHSVFGPNITYQQVVNLAFPNPVSDTLYSVHYVAPKQADGTLAEGQHVQLENGMKFDVTATNRS
jgi:hypothetical protein